jgi:hypothetical protein
MEGCQRSFHPICTKEGLFFTNFTTVDGIIFAISFCEEHSQKFLIEELNFNKI